MSLVDGKDSKRVSGACCASECSGGILALVLVLVLEVSAEWWCWRLWPCRWCAGRVPVPVLAPVVLAVLTLLAVPLVLAEW